MRRIRPLVVATLLAVSVAVLFATDGPLTPMANLAVRTNESGYLRMSGGTPGVTDGPLTPFGNLRGRTDENGYLRVSLASGSMTGPLTVTVDGIATTSTDGIVTQNTTAATGGVTVQMSPRVKWKGSAWDTAASETVEFYAEVLPATAATPTGIWRLGYILNGTPTSTPLQVSSAGLVTASGNFTTVGSYTAGAVGGTQEYRWTSGPLIGAPANGIVTVTNNARTIGSEVKVDALPTVASGFGTSPAVTAGSTPFAGSVNIGTGGIATSGVINFNGTAFPSAPFCVANDSTTTLAQRASASTTQLTITSLAWTASDVVTWVCVSSK